MTAHLRVAPGNGDGERDWVVMLCRQSRDGSWDNLTEGIARVPAAADELTVPLGDVCVQVAEGARLIVLLTGASFPRWDQASAPGPRWVRDGSRVELTVADV